MTTYCTDTCCRPDHEGITSLLLSRRFPVARKEYTCEDCSQPIKVGEQYVREFGLLDGDPYTYIHHFSGGYCALLEYGDPEEVSP